MNHPNNRSETPLLRLFVYGTLKRGYWNHDQYCRDAISIEQATVRGRLYELPSGIPILHVPDEDVLAVGSCDVIADTLIQDRMEADWFDRQPRGPWDAVEGEIIAFATPQMSIPPIDALEGFHPHRGSLYRRVLLPTHLSADLCEISWAYVLGDSSLSECLLPIGDAWP